MWSSGTKPKRNDDKFPRNSKDERKHLVKGRLLKTICNRLIVNGMLPYLKRFGLLDYYETELIRSIVTNNGNWSGAIVLMDILDSGSLYWHEGFILALVKTGQKTLARILDGTLTGRTSAADDHDDHDDEVNDDRADDDNGSIITKQQVIRDLERKDTRQMNSFDAAAAIHVTKPRNVQREEADHTTAGVDSDQADRIRRFAVNHEFQKLQILNKENFRQSKPYEICFRCNHDMHGLCGSYATVQLEDLDQHKPIIDSGVTAKLQWFSDINMKKLDITFTLTDTMLGYLSQHIGKGWEILGLQLGLSEIQIDHINEENPYSATLKRYRMLQKWHDTQGKDATMGRLVAVMKNCHQVNINWNEIKKFIEDYIPHEMHPKETQQT